MNPYTAIGSFLAGGLLFLALGMGLSLMLQKRKPGLQKGMDYECGENPGPGLPGRFNLRFLLPALLFLLFEMEIVVLAPLVLSKFQAPEGTPSDAWLYLLRGEMLIFAGVLLAGLALVLGLSYIEWDRAEPSLYPFQGNVPEFAYDQFNLDQENRTRERRKDQT